MLRLAPIASAPRPRTPASIRSPGSGSTRRTRPSGNNPDTRIATTTATTVPPSTARPARAAATAARCVDVVPTARSAAPASASARTIRSSACATISSDAIAATKAKIHSVLVYGFATRLNVESSWLAGLIS